MTGNMALVVDQTGATLELGTHGTVVLIQCDGARQRVGIKALGSVILHGDVKLSTRLLQALAAHNVALTVLSSRGQTSALGFTRMPDRRLMPRHQQHLAFACAPRRLELARAVLRAKLEAMAEFARGAAPESADAMYRAMRSASGETTIAGLMGIEGAATVRHFEGLAALYERCGIFRFNGRSRRPPLDEPNALMSLSYTLAGGLAAQLALRAGLDVELGFLHAPHHGLLSLTFDLIEPARAHIDRWVHGLLADQCLLTADMFSRPDGGPVTLTKEGRSLFYPAWYRDGYRAALAPMRSLLAGLLTGLRRQAVQADPGAERAGEGASPISW